ncbi:Murein hydrolase activator NlpD precursor [Rickettsiales bacterium Ac37b]|nr:Murein hydrolase activator NlpD precursor [Rickettsiales bacterium Ac37b]
MLKYFTILSLFLIILNISCTSNHPAQIVHLGEKFYGKESKNSLTRVNRKHDKPALNITAESRELLYREQDKSERIIEQSVKVEKNVLVEEEINKNDDANKTEVSEQKIVKNDTVKIVSLQQEDGKANTKVQIEEEVENVTLNNVQSKSNKGYIWPLQGKVISTFGVKGKGIKNDGINIASPEGTKIKAISGGQVLYAGNELRGYGNLLIIKQPDGTLVAYAHQKNIIVKKGDTIKQGEIIGYVGMTGNVSTPQLHLAIRKNKKPVNPLDYLQ